MESLNPKPSSAPTKSKLAKTFHKVIHLRTATRTLSNTGFCLLIPQDHKLSQDPKPESKLLDDNDEPRRSRNRASMEAFVAKLFATISALKAAYAELQMAQFPYNTEAVQPSDRAVVNELTSLSELKQSFLKKQIDSISSPPHVTMLLTEIQEQQSLMKMYELTMKKMRSELDAKQSYISKLQRELDESISSNKLQEQRLSSSGQFSVLDGVQLSDANAISFNVVLNYAVRSIRSFIKVMIRGMESANWDVDSAVNAIIVPRLVFPEPNHRCFAFESFVCLEMFDGFGSHDFSLPNEKNPCVERRKLVFRDRFMKLKGVSPIDFLKSNPNSAFGKFVRAKYLRLVHPKMETSFSGNLGQRKLINSGNYPETEFFAAFADMAKRVWLLHCLAFSFDQEVSIFRVGRNCRYSEVYMESVAGDAFAAAKGGDCRVGFTVVPGFRVGKMVFQSQVYLLPAAVPVNC